LNTIKKKLDTVGDFKSQLQDSETQINAGLERIVNLEQENKQIPTLKAQVSKLKDTVVDLQAKMQDLNFQDETNKQALSDLKEKHEAGQKELKQAKDQLEAARNELRKYEAEASFTPMKSLNEQQTGITDRERFLRLEAENRELKSKLGGGGDLLDELEMTKKLLETTKSKYTEAQRKILTLSQQNTNLTAPSTSSSSTTTTTTTAAAAAATTTTTTTTATTTRTETAGLRPSSSLQRLPSSLFTARRSLHPHSPWRY